MSKHTFSKTEKEQVLLKFKVKAYPFKSITEKTEGKQFLGCVFNGSASCFSLDQVALFSSAHMAVQCLQTQIHVLWAKGSQQYQLRSAQYQPKITPEKEEHAKKALGLRGGLWGHSPRAEPSLEEWSPWINPQCQQTKPWYTLSDYQTC